ncbi:hypothetical protein [Alistipes sp.]|uniref:hypothetical protein n=1 Tax=Alistipes sp. TaxID=1872444 RepID=UPI0025B8AD35|nr:hypothetical protein [Alistipes sp.]
MNANPMEEQIGRLVGNLLAGGGEIFLPGVGSLYTERQGARRLNRHTVQPPSRTVAFTSQQRGVSLVDAIAGVLREAGGSENPEAEAQAVYDRWMARVRRADLLTIEGVGVLKFKNFIPDEAFDLRLNPQGREPVRIRVQRRFDWPLWVGIAAIGIAALYGGRELLLFRSGTPETAVVAEMPGVPDNSGEVGAPDLREGASETEGSVAGDSVALTGRAASEPSVPDAAPEAETADAHSAQEQGDPMALLSGRHYVVLGVFSSEANARRAGREGEAREATFRCRIYRFGGKFMVSPFSSDDAGACAQFIRAQDGRFPDMWTYTAR